ncbi:hypothetical protein DITRI_Ditri20bG0014700 [Diplodiscus trichospermus]
MVQQDSEVQAWWKELREEGHGDKKDEPWWPKMQTLEDLIHSCTIIIWVASARHAAVNFGQYPYEILSKHSSDEVYLGKRNDPDQWTTDAIALKAFNDFGYRLSQIEQKIIQMNNDKTLKNRSGPVKVPYTLLLPTNEAGLTGMGISNSVSN